MTRQDRIAELRALSAPLQRDLSQRQAALAQTGAHAEEFLAALPARNVYGEATEPAAALAAMALAEQPTSMAAALAVVGQFVEPSGYMLGSSRFFGYIPSGSLYESALGDYLAAISNRYAGVGAAAPGATQMEQTLLRWLADIVGYPAGAQGDLTSGGSMATLSAIVTAREAHGLNVGSIPKSVIYLTSQTHHTFRKALQIVGLAECVVRLVAVDERQRLQVTALQEQIEQDRAAGLVPWLVAATAGTTDAGAVDPLDAIADVAELQGLWLHVDAAYGGAFALCAPGRERLQGLARADSLILDPHKGFFLPCGTGVLLVREGHKLLNAFRARGAYMQDVEAAEERSACDLSPELTRPFRALRFWLPLKVHGTAPFAAALEEKLLLAQYFFEALDAIPDLVAVGPPDLSIVNFRFAPSGADPNLAGRALIDAITEDGRVFISSTTIDEQFMIRFAVLNYLSHQEDVDVALAVLAEKSAQVATELRAARG